MIKAQIVADSKNEFGNRITTMVVTFPRIILAEFNTHRMLSKNSASSRAIPFEKMVKAVEENPFIPIAWQKDHKGMQGTEYLTGDYAEQAEFDWLQARNDAVNHAKGMSKGGNFAVTKQLCNRLLEPFMWHTVIVTATEWENFFALRCPQYQIFDQRGTNTLRSKKDVIKFAPDLLNNGIKTKPLTELDWLLLNKGQAEIHMMALAEAMWDAYNESTPKQLKAGEWHIPFEDKIIIDEINPAYDDFELTKYGHKIKCATVMAARTSYTVVGLDQKPMTLRRMCELHDEMLAANPKHMSPFEHCAQAMKEDDTINNVHYEGEHPLYPDGWSGNFRGFVQYRKMIPNENITV